MVQHKKKISDQVSAHAQREEREWKYQKKSIAGGLVSKFSGVQSVFELDRSGRVEVVVVQRGEFVLYS